MLFEKEDMDYTSQTLFSSGLPSKSKQQVEHNRKDNNKDNRTQLCVFCTRNHDSKNCDIITKPEVRKSILQREKRCFVCMATTHQAQNCNKNWKCFKCGGRHNFAICTFKKDERKNDLQQNSTPQTSQT